MRKNFYFILVAIFAATFMTSCGADENGAIEDLGIDNLVKIQKAAKMAKAEAEKEIKIAEAQADEEGAAARAKADANIAKQQL